MNFSISRDSLEDVDALGEPLFLPVKSEHLSPQDSPYESQLIGAIFSSNPEIKIIANSDASASINGVPVEKETLSLLRNIFNKHEFKVGQYDTVFDKDGEITEKPIDVQVKVAVAKNSGLTTLRVYLNQSGRFQKVEIHSPIVSRVQMIKDDSLRYYISPNGRSIVPGDTVANGTNVKVLGF